MSEITIKITGSHTARLTTRTVLDRVRAAVPELGVELVRASHFRESGVCVSQNGESEMQRDLSLIGDTQNVCPICNGEGKIYGWDDNWGCECQTCNGTGRMTE